MFKTRREFLRSTVLGASAAWTVPMFIERTFTGLDAAHKDLAVQGATGKDSTILVVIQLAGGNDGLNTLVPFADDAYYKARPSLRRTEKDIIRLSDHVGLNAAMPYLASLHDEGRLATIQGVGYPNPNRSHFVSTTIWETADPTTHNHSGWLGRFFDNSCPGADPTVGISFTKTQPEAFGARKNPGICMSSPELYRWIHAGGDKDHADEFFNELNRPEATDGASIDMSSGGKPGAIRGESNLAYLERVALDAQLSSKKILGVASRYKTTGSYDGSPVARSLNLVARMIAGGLPTRVYYVSHGGFDTHNNQAGSHDRLLGTLDDALKAFMTDLRAQGNDRRVVVMTFSEFGRRVAQNASGGTDHGQGSCLFVAGTPVKGGLYGTYPSLSDLAQGDLKFTTDFRSVYATVLEGWLKSPAKQVLMQDFPKLGFLG